jgi:hypothetical protein
MRVLLGAVIAAAATSSALASAAERTTLRATLTGRYLHTGSTGSGSAVITITSSRVCWKFSYRGIGTANDSGVHIAPPPVPAKHTHAVFPFTATTSTKPGCVAVTKWGPSGASWAAKIAANPSRYYVIIATKTYRYGAIGGVLHR